MLLIPVVLSSLASAQPEVAARYTRRPDPFLGDSTRLRVSPGAAVVLHTTRYTGYGVGVNIMLQYNAHLETGLDTGAFVWSENGNRLTGIPLMYSMLYRFGGGRLQPFAGFSAGVIWMNAANRESGTSPTPYNQKALLSGTAPGSNVTFIVPAALARAGAELALGRQFSVFAEMKAGIMLDILMVNPQVGFSIGI